MCFSSLFLLIFQQEGQGILGFWFALQKKEVFFEKNAKNRLTVWWCSDYKPLTERRGDKRRPNLLVIQTETPLATAEAVFARSEKREQFDRMISSPAKVGNQFFENWIWRKRNVDGEGLAEPILWFKRLWRSYVSFVTHHYELRFITI